MNKLLESTTAERDSPLHFRFPVLFHIYTSISSHKYPLLTLREPLSTVPRYLASGQNPSHPTNDPQNSTGDSANLSPLIHRRRIAEGLDQFKLPKWKFAYLERFKNLRMSV